MRQIKFRGKRKDNGEWVEGQLFGGDTHCFILITTLHTKKFIKDDDVLCIKDFAEVDPATVGQFTGLTDKDGKEIYEHDVVRFISTEGKEYIHEVTFDIGTLSWCFGQLTYKTIKESGYFQDMHLEVIGSIHDNPELLEKAK